VNTLFIVSGVSGSGKTTLMREVLDNELVSYSTRPMRQGESEGNPYYFITEEQYDQMYNDGEFAEYSNYAGHGYRYAISYDELNDKLAKGDAYVISDVNGMDQFKSIYPNCVSIYIYVEKEEAEKHMRLRGDSEADIEKRLATYEDEISYMYKYDHIVVNRHGEMDETVEKLRNIIDGLV
jgi:guanylate kinase